MTNDEQAAMEQCMERCIGGTPRPGDGDIYIRGWLDSKNYAQQQKAEEPEGVYCADCKGHFPEGTLTNYGSDGGCTHNYGYYWRGEA